MPASKVFTVVLNYRHVDDTLRCVGGLRRSTYLDQHLVVVDNGSTPETEAALRKALPTTTLYTLPDNEGFAVGNNVGIRHALGRGADVVWLVNPDVLPESGSLERLVRTAVERPDAGILGSRILYHRREPPTIWFNGGVIELDRGGATHHLDDGRPDAEVPAEHPLPVDYATGAGMLIRREVFEEIGLLPEDYFLYFEETEFNLRAREAGWSVLVEPRSRMAHDKRSTGRLPAPYYVYYYVRNRLRFGSTFTDMPLDDVLAELEDTWIRAWRRKIEERDAAWLATFDDLIDRAVGDARAGVTGRRDDIAGVPTTGQGS